MDPAALLVVIAAGIVGALGTAHLFLTFWGPKLLPRDPAVREAMQQTHLVITRQTTMWKAWIGFNTTHSMGAMLFGVVYATLAIETPAVLFGSVVLQAAGGLMVVGLVILAKRYFFITPLLGSTIAAACYLTGVVLGGG
jgi:hypothetical protein